MRVRARVNVRGCVRARVRACVRACEANSLAVDHFVVVAVRDRGHDLIEQFLRWCVRARAQVRAKASMCVRVRVYVCV